MSQPPLNPRLPAWLKVRPPHGQAFFKLKANAREKKLHTVCEEARCPNIAECWADNTATFMLMGDTCTRGCKFCQVKTHRAPPPLDTLEPDNVARSVAAMGLAYAVLTTVDRDDLPDQGAGHIAQTLLACRRESPHTLLEILMPDFRGDEACLRTVVQAGPDVLAHNLETVERLTPTVRDPRAGFGQSLELLRRAKAMAPDKYTKSSLMLGLGETREEVLEAMAQMRQAGVDFLTLGQYLRPSPNKLPVVEFVTPQAFDQLAEEGRKMGFAYVASGPLVRSSYKAAEFFIHREVSRRRAGNR